MDVAAPRGTIDPGVALAAIIAVGVVWNPVGNLALPGAWYVPANLLIGTLSVVIARPAVGTSADLGLSRERLGRGVAVGSAAAGAVAAVVGVLVAVPATRTFFESEAVDAAGTAERWYDTLVRIPLGTAVFEELLFRAALLGVLLELVDRRRAVVTASVLFGLWHIVPAWETADGSGWAVTGIVVGTVVLTTIAGALFAGLRLWSGSVVAPMIAHTATNSLSYVAAWVV